MSGTKNPSRIYRYICVASTAHNNATLTQASFVRFSSDPGLKLRVNPDVYPRHVGLYKIFVYFGAFVHESIIRVSPPHCIAHTIATLLHGHCAMCDPPPLTPLLYVIHHTKLVLAISCKGQIHSDLPFLTRSLRRVNPAQPPPTTADTGNTVPQRANLTQTAHAHPRRRAQASLSKCVCVFVVSRGIRPTQAERRAFTFPTPSLCACVCL